jgi:hypothetical protein
VSLMHFARARAEKLVPGFWAREGAKTRRESPAFDSPKGVITAKAGPAPG